MNNSILRPPISCKICASRNPLVWYAGFTCMFRGPQSKGCRQRIFLIVTFLEYSYD